LAGGLFRETCLKSAHVNTQQKISRQRRRNKLKLRVVAGGSTQEADGASKAVNLAVEDDDDEGRDRQRTCQRVHGRFPAVKASHCAVLRSEQRPLDTTHVCGASHTRTHTRIVTVSNIKVDLYWERWRDKRKLMSGYNHRGRLCGSPKVLPRKFFRLHMQKACN